MTQPAIDFWFDFASTYSYPAAMRIGPLAHAAGVAVRLRPFLLGPIFKAQGWDTSPFNLQAAKGRYMWRDLERLCADLALPFRKPNAFPQNSLLAARTALVGLEQGWGDQFCQSVFRAEFGKGCRIDDPAVIAETIRSLKVEARPVLERAQSDDIKARLRAQTDEAAAQGIFGAPAFITASGELFWGNDRLEQALDWARRADALQKS